MQRRQENPPRAEAPEWSRLDVGTGPAESRRDSADSLAERAERALTKGRLYRSSTGRLVNTRAYAIAWGVLNKPYSQRDLLEKCRQDPDAPSYSYLVEKEWRGFCRYYNALVKAGMPPRPPRTDAERRKELSRISGSYGVGLIDKDYDLAKFAAGLNISSKADYERVRRSDPDARAIMPSPVTVVRRFGTWRRFMQEVVKYNVDITITLYVEESARRGHWLTVDECDAIKLPIRKPMSLLRPKIFNVVCYRKLRAAGLEWRDFTRKSEDPKGGPEDEGRE